MKIDTFARLETAACGQVLAIIRSTPDGPSIEVMISPRLGVQPTMRLGPWEETEAGWAAAEDKFRSLNLGKIGAEIAAEVDRLLSAQPPHPPGGATPGEPEKS